MRQSCMGVMVEGASKLKHTATYRGFHIQLHDRVVTWLLN